MRAREHDIQREREREKEREREREAEGVWVCMQVLIRAKRSSLCLAPSADLEGPQGDAHATGAIAHAAGIGLQLKARSAVRDRQAGGLPGCLHHVRIGVHKHS
jgi:hypothetical protein